MLHVPDDLKSYVEQKIESGEFASREEFAYEAIRVCRDVERDYAELRDEVQRSIGQADRGDIEPFDIEAVKVRSRSERTHFSGQIVYRGISSAG